MTRLFHSAWWLLRSNKAHTFNSIGEIKSQFCRIGKDCYLNGGRLSKNNEKLPNLHKLAKKGVLVSNTNMGVCLYI